MDNNYWRDLATVAIFLAATVGIGCYIAVSAALGKTPGLSGFATESAAQVATSSTIQVGPQQVRTLFAANSSCSNRVVVTTGSVVMISNDSYLTPSGARGIQLAASTTNAFSASQYGCGAITAYAYSSSTITLQESIR